MFLLEKFWFTSLSFEILSIKKTAVKLSDLVSTIHNFVGQSSPNSRLNKGSELFLWYGVGGAHSTLNSLLFFQSPSMKNMVITYKKIIIWAISFQVHMQHANLEVID